MPVRSNIIQPLHRGGQCSSRMVLFLVVNIPHNRREILLCKGHHTIFILPVKLEIRLDDEIDVVGTIPFHVAYKFRTGKLGGMETAI